MKNKKKKQDTVLNIHSLTETFFISELQEFQEKVFENAKAKGFWDKERNDGELIALIHSELSEMLEALRKNPKAKDEKCPEFTNLEIEAADVFIRLLDYCAGRKLRLAEAVIAKHKYNLTRPKKHGKKF